MVYFYRYRRQNVALCSVISAVQLYLQYVTIKMNGKGKDKFVPALNYATRHKDV